MRQVHLAASRWPPLIAIHDVGISRAIGWIRPAGWRAAWPLQVPSNSLDVRTTSSGMGPHIMKRRVCLLSTQVLKSTPIFHSGISKIRGAVSHPKPRFKQADSAICLLCISSSVSTASNAWGFSLMAGTRAQDTPIRCLEQGCMGTNATQVVTSPRHRFDAIHLRALGHQNQLVLLGMLWLGSIAFQHSSLSLNHQSRNPNDQVFGSIPLRLDPTLANAMHPLALEKLCPCHELLSKSDWWDPVNPYT